LARGFETSQDGSLFPGPRHIFFLFSDCGSIGSAARQQRGCHVAASIARNSATDLHRLTGIDVLVKVDRPNLKPAHRQALVK
jgi:hypothetical protein